MIGAQERTVEHVHTREQYRDEQRWRPSFFT
jgi:hypothetical protein